MLPKLEGYADGFGGEITIVLRGGWKTDRGLWVVGCGVVCWTARFDRAERFEFAACEIDRDKLVAL